MMTDIWRTVMIGWRFVATKQTAAFALLAILWYHTWNSYLEQYSDQAIGGSLINRQPSSVHIWFFFEKDWRNRLCHHAYSFICIINHSLYLDCCWGKSFDACEWNRGSTKVFFHQKSKVEAYLMIYLEKDFKQTVFTTYFFRKKLLHTN